MESIAIQDQLPPSWQGCFGCGSRNDHGLRIKSFWEGDEVVCTWRPQAHLQGADNILNGGVVATLMDCHTGCASVSYLYRQAGRPLDSEPRMDVVTLNMNVNFLKPVLMNQAVQLRARITSHEGRKIRLSCSVYSGDVEAAHGEFLYLQVDSRPAAPQR